MSELVLTDLNDFVVHRLQERAASRGWTPEEEAKAILLDTLQSDLPRAWAEVDEIYHRLSASGKAFSDSAELVREDRDR